MSPAEPRSGGGFACSVALTSRTIDDPGEKWCNPYKLLTSEAQSRMTTPANRPRTAFDPTTGKEAARKRWEKERKRREAGEDATAQAGAHAGGDVARMRGEGEPEAPDLGLLARDTLAAIASDTSAPHASRVAAARALQERQATQEGGRVLLPEQEARLVAWAGRRIPIELGTPATQASLFD